MIFLPEWNYKHSEIWTGLLWNNFTPVKILTAILGIPDTWNSGSWSAGSSWNYNTKTRNIGLPSSTGTSALLNICYEYLPLNDWDKNFIFIEPKVKKLVYIKIEMEPYFGKMMNHFAQNKGYVREAFVRLANVRQTGFIQKNL